MRNARKLFVAAAVSLSLLGGVFAPAASAEVVISGSVTLPDAVGNSVKIVNKWGDKFGSGFFIKGDRVMTNYHVHTYGMTTAEGNFKAVDGNGNRYTLKLLAYDKEIDLAIYQTDAQGHDYFSISDHEDSSGLKAIVNSYTQDFETLEGGVVNSKWLSSIKFYDGSEVLRDRMLLTFLSTGGNSGSPVLNKENKVVGVVLASANEGYGAKANSAVAIRLEDIKKVVAKAG